MKEDIQTLLSSDLLERYLLGETTIEETLKAEYFIESYPEVKEQYDLLQDNLEEISGLYAVKAPRSLKEEVLAEVHKEIKNNKREFPWYGIAASVAAFLFAMSSYIFYTENESLRSENQTVAQELENLQKNLSSSDNLLANAYEELSRLRNPETQKYVLRGNQRAKNLKTVAYINPIEKVSLINVVDLPKLPEDKVFQMWAEVDGKMVSLGILEQAENKLLRIPFNENALSYNITIEPKGGNANATVENIVANVPAQ